MRERGYTDPGPNAIIRRGMRASVVNGGAQPAQPASSAPTTSRDDRTGLSPRRPARRVSLHGALAQAGRQGNPAEEPEPRVLSDQRRRPRGDAGGGRPHAQTRLRLVPSLLPRSRARACSSASRRSRCCSPPSAPTADPSNGGRQMPSHWGNHGAEHRLRVERHGHAGAARGRRRRGRRDLRAASRDIPDRESRFHARRDRLHVARRGLDERRRILGGAERRLHAGGCRCSFSSRTTATRSRCRSKSQTPGGDISRLVRSFPGLHVDSVDGTDFLASLQRDARGGRVRPRAQGSGARARARRSGPYSHSLSDDEKLYKTPAEREAEARRDPILRFAEFLRASGLATAPELERHRRPRSSARSTRRRSRGAEGAEARQGHGGALGATRPTSIRRRPPSTRPRSPRASPTRWSRPSTAR